MMALTSSMAPMRSCASSICSMGLTMAFSWPAVCSVTCAGRDHVGVFGGQAVAALPAGVVPGHHLGLLQRVDLEQHLGAQAARGLHRRDLVDAYHVAERLPRRHHVPGAGQRPLELGHLHAAQGADRLLVDARGAGRGGRRLVGARVGFAQSDLLDDADVLLVLRGGRDLCGAFAGRFHQTRVHPHVRGPTARQHGWHQYPERCLHLILHSEPPSCAIPTGGRRPRRPHAKPANRCSRP